MSQFGQAINPSIRINANSSDGQKPLEPKEKILKLLHEKQLSVILLLSEVLFLILYGSLVDYGPNAGTLSENQHAFANNSLVKYYAMFQDVHVMIFVGFGFLMTFLKKYAYSAIGFNFLVAAYTIQWAMLFRGFFQLAHHQIYHDEVHQDAANNINIEITELINADFCAGSVLISMGALLGTISAPQYVLMAFFEVVFYAINEYINYDLLQIADIGGSIVIHTFGAYFGLACSRILYSDAAMTSQKEKASYFDDMFAMIGTLFLWMYWPSFNAALSETESGESAHRTVINTYLSLTACCVAAFAMSSFVNEDRKLDMAHIQNATLAGGVAIGASANLLISPVGAAVVGAIAGTISVLGYRFMTPILKEKLKIHDTCGVHNLHGMPGILGGIVGIIMALLASVDNYGSYLSDFYPARTVVGGRTAGVQAAIQVAGLCCTIGIAILGGVLTGFILKLPCWLKLEERDYYDDAHFWELPVEIVRGTPMLKRRQLEVQDECFKHKD